MSGASELKTELLRVGLVTEEKMAEAESQATKERLALEDTLVRRGIVSQAQVGQALARIHRLPYSPVLASRRSSQEQLPFSAKCAKHWSVFPVTYDPDQHLLTLAVHEPGQMAQMESVTSFFLEQHTIAFTVAPKSEIVKAIETHFARELAPPAAPTPEQEEKPGPMKFPPLGTIRKKKPLRSLPSKPKEPKPTAKIEKDDSKVDGFPAELVSQSLVSAASLLASAYLGEDTDGIRNARAHVRYAQLLATRLDLPRASLDKILLTAWLSSLTDRPNIIKRFVTPYNLDELLFPDQNSTAEQPVELQVLTLVRCYQDLREEDPEAYKDVSMTRRNLRLQWSAAADRHEMLEAFLQLLMDEEFLSQLDHTAGSIIVADPSEISTSNVVPPLMNDGFEVTVAPTAEAALEAIQKAMPNLLIAGMDLPDKGGLDLCRKVKGNPDTHGVPVLILIAGDAEKRAAECLRAGADDYLTKPVDPELLFIKVQRMITVPATETDKDGVSGSLEDMSFTDMIQILSAGGKSMEIVVADKNREGRVFIKQGSVVHAAVDDLQGEDAFYELMSWNEGDFTTGKCREFPAPTIQSSTMSLLMEGARQVDEGRGQ